jgi:hypothetical protein
VKVGAHLYSYPPIRLLGAELMTSELLSALAGRGHECKVATIAGTDPYIYRGVAVSQRMVDLLSVGEDAPDVFVTHPELAEFNFHRAKGLGAKTVAVVHNVRDEAVRGLQQHPFDLIVANAEGTQRFLADVLGLQSVLVRPPTILHHPPSAPLPRRFVTLVNLTPDKGGELFYRLADARPDLHFLGVIGGYGEQVIEERPNVTLMSQTVAMGLVFALSRVVIMPSKHESWGRVGCEALAAGVPVIAADIPALRESLGDAASFCPLEDDDAWVSALRALDRHPAWEAASFNALARGAELLEQTDIDMAEWVSLVEAL